MKNLTDERPKPMLPLRGKPMLAHIIERMETSGVREILVITGYKAEIVESYFAEHPPAQARISFRRQEKLDGTGSAALLGREFAGGEPFLLTFGDILVEPSVYAGLFERAGEADAALAVNRVDDPYQGAAVYVSGERVERIIEKPPRGTSTTPWNNAGVYCFPPQVFSYLERLQPSPRGEYELTDAVQGMLEDGLRFSCYPVEGFWRDVGRPEDLPAAERHLED